MLVTTSAELARQVTDQLQRQVPALSRAGILEQSVANIRLIVVDSLDTAFAVANDYAPEHLLLEVREPRRWLARVTAAGAGVPRQLVARIGGRLLQRPESHAAHVWIRQGLQRFVAGGFSKTHHGAGTVAGGPQTTGPTAQVLAGLEGLDAHAAAVTIRLAALERGEAS